MCCYSIVSFAAMVASHWNPDLMLDLGAEVLGAEFAPFMNQSSASSLEHLALLLPSEERSLPKKTYLSFRGNDEHEF